MTDSPLSAEEILGGNLGGRRRALVLLAIEQRVRELEREDHQAAAGRAIPADSPHRESQFLGALAETRDRLDDEPVAAPQLERFAEQWSDLVPSDASGRASLFVEMARRYRLDSGRMPRIRRAVGLDTPEVGNALEARKIPDWRELAAADLRRTERLRWRAVPVSVAVDTLPTALLVAALVFTSVVGGGILALPLATAAVGPGTAVVALMVAGGFYTLAMLAQIDAVTRTAPRRRGGGAIGALAREHLGPIPGRVAGGVMTALLVANIIGQTVGFGGAMAEATSLPDWMWGAALGLTIVSIIGRKSLDTTIVVTLAAGAINVLLLSVVASLAFSAGSLSRPFDSIAMFELGPVRGFLGAVFGLMASIFAAQIGVLNASALALRRDPSGDSLWRGTRWAMAATLGAYVGFLFACLAAVPREDLASATGTAVGPLSDAVGRGTPLFAGAFAILAMGVLALQCAIGLRNQFRESVPERWSHLRLDAAPTLVSVGVAILLLAADRDVFVQLLSMMGALGEPLVAGVIPALLLLVARRQPQRTVASRPWRWRLVTTLAAFVLAYYIVGVFLHAAVIYEDPTRRLGAALVVVISVGVAMSAFRERRLAERVYVEVEAGPTADTVQWVHVAHERSLVQAAGEAEIPIEPEVAVLVRLLDDRPEVMWAADVVGVEARALAGPADHFFEAGPGGIITIATSRNARWER